MPASAESRRRRAGRRVPLRARIKIDCNGQSVCTAQKTIKLAPPTYVIAVAVQADGGHVVSAPIWFGE